jgi:hypothetical protein
MLKILSKTAPAEPSFIARLAASTSKWALSIIRIDVSSQIIGWLNAVVRTTARRNLDDVGGAGKAARAQC